MSFGHKPLIDQTMHRFVQDGNTLGTTTETESIEIFTERQLPGDHPFFVIKTNGWSFDSIDEFVELLKSVSLVGVTTGGE